MIKTYAAGAVVLGDKGNILVVNQNGTSWSLPKGHIEHGESEQQAAERETKEESGISGLTFIKKLGSYERYQIGRDGGENKDELKYITFFLCRAKEVIPKPIDPTNPEARWVAPNEVSALLTHPKDQAFFEGILPELDTVIKAKEK
jgi:bis(5'-nucleosidyl)-tetraphosphatase